MAADSNGVSPLMQKVAYFGAGATGVFVTVTMMIQFSETLKPLALAAMFVACLESLVDLLEKNIAALCRRCIGKAPKVSAEELGEPLSPARSDAEQGAAPAQESTALRYILPFARPLAVVISLCLVAATLFGIGVGLARSVSASAHLDIYMKGYQELQEGAEAFVKSHFPGSQQQLDQRLGQMKSDVEGVARSALAKILDLTSGFFATFVMFLIYVLMWLLVPMKSKGHQRVFTIMRVFFALKAACNLCFAALTWLLLEWLHVDLAIVMALLSFFLGFIPEVGAILAGLLPVPVILLDSRQDMMDRWGKLAWALGGLLLIKFAVSNGLESVVMGSNRVLAGASRQAKEYGETHPVIVLSAVVLLGQIWGSTGMLVSVPLISMIRLGISLHEKQEESRLTNARAEEERRSA